MAYVVNKYKKLTLVKLDSIMLSLIVVKCDLS